MSPRERERGYAERRMSVPDALSTASTSTGSGSGSAAPGAGYGRSVASRRSEDRDRWQTSRSRTLSVSTHHHPASADRHYNGRDAYAGGYGGGSRDGYGTPVSAMRETVYPGAIGWGSAGAGAGGAFYSVLSFRKADGGW